VVAVSGDPRAEDVLADSVCLAVQNYAHCGAACQHRGVSPNVSTAEYWCSGWRIAGNAVALELTDDRVLSFHSQPSGGCPGLDWHLVAGTNNRLTGLIAWDDMKNVARVSGSANKDGKFHLALQPLHGVSSEGSVEGQLPDYNGWLTASVTGAGCPHQEVHVQWFRRAGPDSR